MLVRRVHLREVLVLNFDSDKQLDALVVFVLVARDERRLLTRGEGLLGGGRPWSGALAVRSGREVGGVLRALLELHSLRLACLLCDFALLVDVSEVAARLDICGLLRGFLGVWLAESVGELALRR